MRVGPAFLQFDWSKASLSMNLPVFVYSHTKTSFKSLSRQGIVRRMSASFQYKCAKNGKGLKIGKKEADTILSSY